MLSAVIAFSSAIVCRAACEASPVDRERIAHVGVFAAGAAGGRTGGAFCVPQERQRLARDMAVDIDSTSQHYATVRVKGFRHFTARRGNPSVFVIDVPYFAVNSVFRVVDSPFLI